METLKEITWFEIPCSPKLALLGIMSDIPLDKRNKVPFIKLAMIAGNKCITLLRKSADPPPVKMVKIAATEAEISRLLVPMQYVKLQQ